MEKHEAANESPPAYAEVALALDWYPGSPPPPYPIPDHPQFHSTTLQFPLSTNQLTVARPLHDVVAPLPPQRNQHLQQQQVVEVSAVYRQPVRVQHVHSFVKHVVFSCIVYFVFCNWICGLIALILAVMASNKAVSEPRRARKLGRASIGFSVSGVVVSVIAVVISVCIMTTRDDSCEYIYYQGSCYRYKTYVGSSGLCVSGVKTSSGYCYSNYCSNYKYRGSCYKSRKYVGDSVSCSSGVLSSSGYCYFSCVHYEYAGSCYNYMNYVGRSGSCTGVRTPADYCYYTSCPHYEYLGSCYKYKKHAGSSGTCNASNVVTSADGYCYSNPCPDYEYDGICYKYKKGDSLRPCSGVISPDGYCYYDFCPYYIHRGLCFKYKDYVGLYRYCSGFRAGAYCYYDRY